MRKELIQDILGILEYRNGNYCIGGIGRIKIADILGLNYGHTKPGEYERAIHNAGKSKLLEIHEYLKNDIQYMKKNPVTICKHCGK